MTMYSENQLQSLRKKYNKTFWSYVGVSVLSMAAAFFLVYSSLLAVESLLPWLIASGVGLALGAVEFAAERALYKRGKKADLLLIGFFLAVLIGGIILAEARVFGGYSYLFYPVLLGLLFNRPLLPAIGLLLDFRSVNDGTPRESIGRMKPGTTRRSTNVGIDSYLLFEDELTGEVRLLLMGSMDPSRRYRVLYLPHSGLAVGEVIPDDVEFDPFGNPMERDDTEEKPAYTEDTYADKPDYSEPNDTEPPHTLPTPEELDPNSPARKKAAKFALASKVCKILAYAGVGFTFIGGIILDDSPGAILVLPAILLVFGGFLLGDYFKKQDRKLRCTRRTTARCIDTVRRKSGKHSSTLHPIVGYEVDGVSYTAELSVSCSQGSIGELYTICYDPLDPQSVRPA